MVERVVVGPWKTNCYIYSSAKKECIVIDPGGSEQEIEARVDVLNMVPVGIALTHGHVDHLAGLARLRASYASRGYKLPIAVHQADRRFLGTGGREIHRESLEFLGLDELSFFGVSPDELPRADVKLAEGDRVFNMDIIVMETPGHTPGSVCFYSEKEGILFSGDTLFFDGVGRTDLPGGSEKKLRESIQKKIAVLPPEVRVFPGHGPFTTVEREKRGNSYFKVSAAETRPNAGPAPLLQIKKAAAAVGVPAASRPPAAKTTSPVRRPGTKVSPRSPGKAREQTLRDRGAPGAARPGAARPGTKAQAARPGASSKPAKKPIGPAKAGKKAAKPGVKAQAAGKSAKKPAAGVRKSIFSLVRKGMKPNQANRSTKAPGTGSRPGR
jgi:hydroxyacylglutathione hydrolase